jgi:hypothetical protein
LIPLISSCIKIPSIYGILLGKIIYFSGAYVLGMYLGGNIEASMNWIKKYAFAIFLLAGISTIILCYLHFSDINKFHGIALQDAAYYIQKICIGFLAIIFFKQLGEKQPVWLTKVAADSTPVYFIHGAIVFSYSPLFLFRVNGAYTPFTIVVSATALLLFTIVFSMFVAFLIKKIFGKKSRMIIGA